MSEDAQQEDKTEQPTPKRLEDASKKGQVPRSKELANVAVLGAASLSVLAMAPMIGSGARGWLRHALTVDPALLEAPERLAGHFAALLLSLLLVVAPVILVALAACFISPMVMGGIKFSAEALQPKMERLSPVAGIKRMWGSEAGVEFLKSLLRVLIVGGVGTLVLSSAFSTFLVMPRMDLASAASIGTGVVGKALVMIVGAMGFLALLDIPWQHLSHVRKLRMTKQEVKEEMKQQEGNPELKARVRQVQRQMASQRMMEDVPTADVVIVNPTHYAVALRYEGSRMSAPLVVARGVDEIALHIRSIARENNVAIVEAPPLARVLYRQSQTGKEIPVQLYTAVAQVLTYVFQLQRWHPGHGPMPQFSPIPIDEKQEA